MFEFMAENGVTLKIHLPELQKLALWKQVETPDDYHRCLMDNPDALRSCNECETCPFCTNINEDYVDAYDKMRAIQELYDKYSSCSIRGNKLTTLKKKQYKLFNKPCIYGEE